MKDKTITMKVEEMDYTDLVDRLIEANGVLSLNPNGFSGAHEEYAALKKLYQELKDEVLRRLGEGEYYEQEYHLETYEG